MKIVAVIIFTLIMGLLVILFSTMSNPVLWKLTEPGDPSFEPIFIILHPFRDRAPERVANSMFDLWAKGNIENAQDLLSNLDVLPSAIIDDNPDSLVTRWKLRNRKDKADSTELFYTVARGTSRDLHTMIWVQLEYSGEDWKILRINGCW